MMRKCEFHPNLIITRCIIASDHFGKFRAPHKGEIRIVCTSRDHRFANLMTENSRKGERKERKKKGTLLSFVPDQ